MWGGFEIFMDPGWIQDELFPLPAQLPYFFHGPRFGSGLCQQIFYISP